MWDPQQYLAFGDHRSRPFFELLARVPAVAPRAVVDLGCGPGNLTAMLADLWPGARVEALDSSPEMVAAARDRGLAADVADVTGWCPPPDADVVVSSAVLQWVPDHDALLCRWVRDLPEGAWLAFQVPGNFAEPSHALVRALVASPRWRDRLPGVGLRDERAVSSPEGYATLLAEQGCAVDAWETTYLQRLTGDDPVLEWISGTALRPVSAALGEPEWAEFRAELAPMLREAYPRRADGGTWFPFRRIFVVAHIGAGQ